MITTNRENKDFLGSTTILLGMPVIPAFYYKYLEDSHQNSSKVPINHWAEVNNVLEQLISITTLGLLF